jgi:hypothetical protein
LMAVRLGGTLGHGKVSLRQVLLDGFRNSIRP